MSASNRRQPTRSARTSTTRPANYYARPYGFPGASVPQDSDAVEESTPGFFPAITHFTDAVAALPREVMQHLTLLRETEGKAYAPEQAISQIVNTITKLPPPPKHQLSAHTQAYMGFSLNNSVNNSANGSMVDGHLPASRPTTASTNAIQYTPDPFTDIRRTAFFHLREKLKEVIGILDEKNMVLTTANETLVKQLSRLEGTLPHVEQEISEEARLGSNTHWALPHMKEQRKPTGAATERSRREIQAANNLAAAAAAVAESDLPPTRSETRREAMQAKRKVQNIDSDFDDRPGGRKQTNAKVRRTQDTATVVETKGASTAAVPAPVTKRRRVDKPAAPTMERSASGMGAGKATASKDTMGSRDGPVPEGARKNKPKPLSLAQATRKRNTANSPSRAQTPSRGTFPTSTAAAAPNINAAVVRDQSPTPHNARAATAARGRQNSTQSLKSVQDRIRNPTSSLINGKNASAMKASTPELKTAADVTGRTLAETRAALTDAYRNAGGERTLEEEGVAGALVPNPHSSNTRPRPGSSALKREETEPRDTANYYHTADLISTPTPQSVPMATTRSRNGITKPAKAATPSAGAAANRNHSEPATTIPPMSRSRSVRGVAATNAAPGGSSPTLGPTGSGSGMPRRPHKRAAGGTRNLDSPSRSSGSSVDGRNAGTAASAAPTGPSSRTVIASRQPSTRRSPQRPSGSLSPPHSPISDPGASHPLSAPGLDGATSAPVPARGSNHNHTNNDNDGDAEGDANPDIDADIDANTNAEPEGEEGEAENAGEGEGPSSPASDEPRYCVCGQVSYGDMIACDNDSCPREWFHLQCVGLTKAPGSKAKWYCDECKDVLRRGGGGIRA